ncbi:MAG TPA: DUF418 domain-containing protein [Allosphingosinicella sp.]|nr:DUF418 domain-containing protein [Allosphingosinicella sp.]
MALTEAENAAPAARRIEALDFVRGVALCGILLMNITGFGLPDAYVNPMNAGGATGANLWAWIVTEIGFEGTQRALFSMLFGASAILLVSRLEAAGRTDAADIYFRRNLWLVAFGMVNAFVFLWYGDILYAYGIIALFIFPFRKLAAKWLLAIGIATLLLNAVWNLHDTRVLLGKHDAWAAASAAQARGARLNPDQQAAITAWDETRAEFKSTPEEIADAVQARVNGYGPAFERTARINVYFQTWGLYRFFFDLFGMMLIGMALYRTGVLTLERRTSLYVAMAVFGYGIGVAVNAVETRWIMNQGFSAVSFAEAHVSYDLGRLAMTIGHLGALLLFVRSGLLGWLRRAFAAVGQMAVTNYLTHSVVCGILFIGLGWYNQLERYELYYVVAAIWAAQLAISPLWLSYYRFGPVEWLWRSLTYMKRQPIRRIAAETGA